MKPQTCGECEYFADAPGRCLLSKSMMPTFPGYPPSSLCPLPAEPKRTETFERWVLKDKDGNMILPKGCEPFGLMIEDIARMGARAHGLACGKVRVTVEEIE